MGDVDTIHHWPPIDPFRTTSSSLDHNESDSRDVLIMKKIQSAFGNVKAFPLKRIMIQLWAPMKVDGKEVLSCDGYPCTFMHLNRRLSMYRAVCCKYYCSFAMSGRTSDAFTIPGAAPTTAALNGFPEVVLDLTVHRRTPLVDLALECELTCFMMLPVFDETKCQGVIEVSARKPCDLLVIFNELYCEIQSVGLSLTPLKDLVTPMPVSPLPYDVAISEFEKALQVAVESHAIAIGRVWVPYKNIITVPPVMRMRVLLTRFGNAYFGNLVGDDHLCLELFSRNLHVLPYTKGKGLVARTLKTKLPHLCRNISTLNENEGLMALFSTYAKSYACFVIDLRSSHTEGVHYMFEFFWPQSYNHLALMEDLLLTLKEHLPSFKFFSGAQLGHEMLVVDFENSSSSSSSGSENKTIKIFPSNEKSKVPRATTASVGMKRKSIDLHDGPEDENDQEDEEDLVIIAFCKDGHKLFFLPSTTTFQNVMDKVKQEFEQELNLVGTYKVDYQVLPGKWYRLTEDRCLKNCVSSYRASSGIDYIKFCVIPSEE